jgi:hypothetical protein
MRVNWMAGGPQKACADFNLRTHSTFYNRPKLKRGAWALVKKDDMVQTYRIRSEVKGWVKSAGE